MRYCKSIKIKSENPQVRKSVTGFSRLEYILGVQNAQGMAGQFYDKHSFKFDEAHRVVKEVALSIEASRRHYARTRIDAYRLGYGVEGRELEGYGKSKLQNITKRAISGLIKWKLIERVSTEQYRPLEGLKKVGSLSRTGELNTAKTLLYHFMIRKESPFSPRRFLINLRDYEVEKITFSDPKNIEIPRHEDGGIAYTDDGFIDHLHTNSWSIAIMSDWGEFFELTDWFPESFIVNDTKRHCRMLILSKRMASFEELRNMYAFKKEEAIDDLNVLLEEFSKKYSLNMYAVKSIYGCAEKLGLLKVADGKVQCGRSLEYNEMINKALNEKGLVVADSDEYRGVIFDTSSPTISNDQIFTLMDEDIGLERFYDVLYNGFVDAVEGKTYENAWVHKVRKLVCKSLRINSLKFDELLTRFLIKVGPPYIELGKVSLREPPEYKPFIYMGSRYHMIKVRKK